MKLRCPISWKALGGIMKWKKSRWGHRFMAALWEWTRTHFRANLMITWFHMKHEIWSMGINGDYMKPHPCNHEIMKLTWLHEITYENNMFHMKSHMKSLMKLHMELNMTWNITSWNHEIWNWELHNYIWNFTKAWNYIWRLHDLICNYISRHFR